jgi:hypothetical protein
VRDDYGQLPTLPLLPHEAFIAGDPPAIGEVAGPLLVYSQGVTGPLTTDATVDGSGRAAPGTPTVSANQPVSTGSCEIRAGQFRGFHSERDRRGDAPYFYGSGSGATCTNAVDSSYCYTELWRSRDGAFLEQEGMRDNSGPQDCSAVVYHGYYERPTRHYSKNRIQMDAGRGAWWGNGRGPRGWDCSGQGTRYLTCGRDTGPES